MVHKKPDKKSTTKKIRKRRSSYSQEDVQVHTSLPPKVDGQLRCYLKLSVNQIIWIVPNAPDVTYVRVKWWGEDGDGTVFRPVDVKKGDKSSTYKTTARFAIRSGPKQFAAYIADMSSLILDVLSGAVMVTVGRTQIDELSLLSPNRPINGFFPVFSPNNDKIAELQVSMVLESIMASYDSSGSIPTTDISMETTPRSIDDEPSNPPSLVPHPHIKHSDLDDPFKSPAPKANRPLDLAENKMHDIDDYQADEHLRQRTTEYTHVAHEQRQPDFSATTHTGSDLISALLTKGEKLKENMVKSQLVAEKHIERGPGSQPSRIPDDGLHDDVLNVSKRSNSFLKDLLDGDVEQQRYQDDSVFDTESRAVDLVFNANVTDRELKALKALDGDVMDKTVSDDNEDVVSDLGDPLHDDTILHDLFYKNPDSDTSYVSSDEGNKSVRSRVSSVESLDEPGNMRPPSRKSTSSRNSSSITPKQAAKKEKSKPPPKSKIPRRKSSKERLKSKKRSSQQKSSGSEFSDNDSLNHSVKSDGSRVSFDMTPSDAEDTTIGSRSAPVDGLSVERLTLLGRVHVARVVIDSLNLQPALDTSKSSTGSSVATRRGKPPIPASQPKSSTYFVEYQFPVVASTRDKFAPNAMATEVMRVASKKVKDGDVLFNHRSVFPVLFDGTAIEKWWKAALVFKVFSRTAGQHIPSLLGSCSIPLKAVLKSEGLYVNKKLGVKDRSSNSSSSSTPRKHSYTENGRLIIGHLQASVELASDSKDFSTALAKTRLAEMRNSKVVPIPQPKPSQPTYPNPHRKTPQGTQSDPQRQDIAHMPQGEPVNEYTQTNPGHGVQTTQNTQKHLQPQPMLSGHQQSTYYDQHYEPITLHTLLYIPEGRNINLHGSIPSAKPPKPTSLSSAGIHGRDMATRNLYLNCRMFWSDDVVASSVCWGTFEPTFNFIQVAPILLTTSLLERLRNNFMVVEVWDKKTAAHNDQLVGIVKLPLHQMYMSFRDRKIQMALLKSQYPVVAVDNYLPIINPFSGTHFGQLKVLLAMGSTEQVSSLQRLKIEGNTNVSGPERPLSYLERQHVVQQHDSVKTDDTCVEHVFEMVVEGIRGLKLFTDMIWGEADCFVQYHFPAQQQTKQVGLPNISHATVTVKPYRTATTLCIPDPTFHDVTRHRITLPNGTPVQRELLTACAGVGGGGGGIPFEAWCRYYHPNVRDQVIAKATLPLAKLCAMVTMQKKGEANVQSFSLPLTHVGTESMSPDEKAKCKESGLIDVTIHYKTSHLKTPSATSTSATSKNMAGSQVCITMNIVRASGLKFAAEAIARLDHGMQYPAEVGVNAYLRIKLSFLSNEDERVSRTVARTFSPDFSTQLDFPCPLLWTEASSDALSLAEILETAEVNIEVWHQVPGLNTGLDGQYVYTGSSEVAGHRLVTKTGDVLLGTVTLPLLPLLSHKTGLNGWFPIYKPPLGWDRRDDAVDNTCGNRGLERVAGGLELAIRFAHHDDRGRVIHAGRGVGWSPEVDINDDWECLEDMGEVYNEVTISVDMACFPVQNALLTGQNKLDKDARCYIRYKFYDKAPVSSKLSKVDVNEEHYIMIKLTHNHKLQVQFTAPFNWYMQEEKLELQMWLTISDRHKGDSVRPKHRDKLIGSAYINMDSLTSTRRKQHRISGVYPVFKPGSASLGGAYIRAHITRNSYDGKPEQALSDKEAQHMYNSSEESEEECPVRKGSKVNKKTEEKVVIPTENSFRVHIKVERAAHVGYITEKHSHERIAPNCYVSYQTSDKTSTTHTTTHPNTDTPVWDHDNDTYLSKDLLSNDNKNLVFKIWHKPSFATDSPDKSSDRVLGFVSVDLAPLSSGLQQISGWYNIMDFTGQCQGQIKISVVPLENITSYRTRSTPTSPTKARNYHTTASYECFPSHISSYSEQSIHYEQVPGPSRPVQSGVHYAEHYTNVMRHHQQLKEQQERQEHAQFIEPLEEDSTSRSMLFANLRSNLQELDSINARFTCKLLGKETSFCQTTDQLSNRNNSHRTNMIPDKTAPCDESTVLKRPGHHPTVRDDHPHNSERRHSIEVIEDTVYSPTRKQVKPDKRHITTYQVHEEDNAYKSPSLSPSNIRSVVTHLNFDDIEEGEMQNGHASSNSAPLSQLVPDYQGQQGITVIAPSDELGDYHPTSEPCSESESESDGEVVVPRALNDISSPSFDNSVLPDSVVSSHPPGHQPSHDIPQDHGQLNIDHLVQSVDHKKPRTQGYQSSYQEKDSWFSDNSESVSMISDVSDIRSPTEVRSGNISDAAQITEVTNMKDTWLGDTFKEDLEKTLELSEMLKSVRYPPNVERSESETSSGSIHDNQARTSAIEGKIERSEQEHLSHNNDNYMTDRKSPIIPSNTPSSTLQTPSPLSDIEAVLPDQQQHEGDPMLSRSTSPSSDGQDIQSEDEYEVDERVTHQTYTRHGEPTTEHVTGSDRTSTAASKLSLPPQVPSFFIPPKQLAESMRAVRVATSHKVQDQENADPDTRREKQLYTKQFVDRLNTGNASEHKTMKINSKQRPLPTADEAKRIAKIFSLRFA